MNERAVEIIIALADSNMRVSDAAKKLFVHPGTVRYHMAKVKRMTGLDPFNFYDLCKLVTMANGERKDNGQTENVRDEQNLHPQFQSRQQKKEVVRRT